MKKFLPRRRKAINSVNRRRQTIEALESRQLLAADLGLIETGLKADFFANLQGELDQTVFNAPAPLVGDQLRIAQSFVQSVGIEVADFDAGASPSTATVQNELQQQFASILGPGGVQVIGSDGDDEIRFRINLQDTESFTLDVDYGLGDEGILQAKLGNEGKLDTTIQWNWILEIGVRDIAGTTEFFVATKRPDELTAELTATIADTFTDVQGLAGVLAATMSVDTNEAVSQFVGNYTIDLQDVDSDNALTINEMTGLTVDGTLDGDGQVHLDLAAEFFPDFASVGPDETLFNLAINADASIVYEFDNAPTEVFDEVTGEQIRTFGNDEAIVYENLELDLGTLFENFINPLIVGIQDVLEPVKPIVDFMTDPVPLISDLSTRNGGDEINLFTLAKLSVGANGTARRRIEKAESAVELMNRILDYTPPGTGDLTDVTAGLGGFEITRNKTKYLVFENDHPADDEEERNRKKRLRTDAHRLKHKYFSDFQPGDIPTGAERDFFANFAGDLQFPVLNDPENLAALLIGDTSPDLFVFSTELDFGISETLKYPIFPGLLSAELGLGINAMIDLDIGYDGLGIDRLTDTLDFSSQSALQASYEDYAFLLKDGFYADDHNPNLITDGSSISTIPSDTNEQPEVVLSASLSLGAVAGLDLLVLNFTVDLTGTFSANINFDLNDLPNTLPIDQWASPLEPAYPDYEEWTYDGRVRLGELEAVVNADPLSLFNVAGEMVVGLSVGLNATLGIDPFLVTIYNKRWKLIEKPVFNYQITQLNDADIIDVITGAAAPLSAPVLGAVDAAGELSLYAGSTAGDRRFTNVARTGIDSVTDEAFSVRSFGPSDPEDPAAGDTILVTFSETRGEVPPDPNEKQIYARQLFRNVKSIRGNGGGGNDFFDINSNVELPVHLLGGDGNDVLFHTGSGSATLDGGIGDDLLIGGTAGDILIGGAGNDELIGGGGADDLQGGSGNDMLDGGFDGVAAPAIDTLSGGTGDDVYNWQLGGGNDVINDIGGGNDELFVIGGNEILTGGRAGENSVVVPADDLIVIQNTAGGLMIQNGTVGLGDSIFVNDIERLAVAPGDGDDTVNISSLTGSSVLDLGIDLSQLNPEKSGDTVVYTGFSGEDVIDVRAIDATNLGEQPGVAYSGKSVVKIADSSLTTERTVYVINSDPDVDQLVVRGLEGDDRLSVSASAVGASVLDLIDVTLLGQSGDDILSTILLDVEIDGGTDDDQLIVLGSTSLAEPEIEVNSDRLVIRDRGTSLANSLIEFSNVESLQVQLAEKIAGNQVTVLSTLPGVNEPIRVIDADGNGPDQFVIQSTQSPVQLDLIGGDNLVSLGKGGSLSFIEAPLTVTGGSGNDEVVFDASGSTLPQTVDLGRYNVSGVGASAPITFDDAIETIGLLLGSGNDFVQFGVVAGAALPGTLNRKARVVGGSGDDTLSFAFSGDPVGTFANPDAPRVETTSVENVDFSVEGTIDGASWLLDNGGLRVGLPVGATATIPENYPQAVFAAPDAESINIRLNPSASRADQIRVWSVPQATTIDAGIGGDLVSVGDSLHRLEDLNATLDLQIAGGQLIVDDSGAAGPSQVAIGAERIEGFGLTGITFDVIDELQWIGSLHNQSVTLDGIDADTTVSLAGGTDTVTVVSAGGPVTIDLGGNVNNESDTVIVHSADAAVDVTGGAESDTLRFVGPATSQMGALQDSGNPAFPHRLAFPGTAPEINFALIDQVELMMGDRGDEITLDYDEPLDFLEVSGGGGPDRLIAGAIGGPVNFVHGGGPDELVIAVPGSPDSLATSNFQTNLTFTGGLEQLTIDNSAYAQPVDWIVDSGNLYAGANPVPLLQVTGASRALIRGGSDVDTLTIREQSDSPVDVTITGDNVRVDSGEVVLQPGSFLNDGIELPRTFARGLQLGGASRDAQAVAHGDLDGDGDLDAFLGRNGPNRVLISQVTESGGLIPWDDFETSFFFDNGQDLGDVRTLGVALEDLDGDGDLDGISTDVDAVRLWINQGNDQFGTPGTFELATQSFAGEFAPGGIGDFDGDGDIDLILARTILGLPSQWVINQGGDQGGSEGTFFAQPLTFPVRTSHTHVGDMDQDGDLDLVLTGGAVMLNDGDATFTQATALVENGNAPPSVSTLVFDDYGGEHLALGDVDGDGDLDVVSVLNSELVYLFENTLNSSYPNLGDPSEPLQEVYAALTDIADVDLGDLDDDGDLDLFVTVDSTRDLYGDSFHFGLENTGGIFNQTPFVLEFDLENAPYEYTYAHESKLADFNGDGKLDVLVARDGFTGSGLFLRPGSDNVPTAGNETSAIASGDFDNDGDDDLIIAQNDRVRIWNNQGGTQGGVPGTFIPGAAFCCEGGATISDIHVGDIDSDGDLDIVINERGLLDPYAFRPYGPAVFKNNPDDPFAPFRIRNDLGILNYASFYGDSALGDIDGDGDLDIVAVHGYPDDHRLITHRNRGNGFPSGDENKDLIYLGPGIAPTDLELADFNGDGSLDVVLTHDGADQVLLSVGGKIGYVDESHFLRPLIPEFQSPVGPVGDPISNTQTTAVFPHDIDGDGDPDLIVTTTAGDNQIWINQGVITELRDPGDSESGTFDRIDFVDGGSLGNADANDVTLADFDQDGDDDVVLVRADGNAEYWIHEGIDSNTLLPIFVRMDPIAASDLFPGTAGTFAAVAFDAEGDSDQDLVFLDSTERDQIWVNQIAVQSTDVTRLTDTGQNLGDTDPFANAAALGDLDNDGDLDAFLVDAGANRVWINQGGNQVGDPTTLIDSAQLLGNSHSTDVALGDIDGDGDLDAFVTNGNDSYGNADRIWINEGVNSMTFVDSGQRLGDTHSTSVELADLDGDGHLDAFVGTDSGNQIWIGDGAGGFTASGGIIGIYASDDINLGDLDGDGDLDALTISRNSDPSRMWMNNGAAGFTEHPLLIGFNQSGSFVEVTHLDSLSLGDFYNDGDLDAYVASGERRFRLRNDGVAPDGSIIFDIAHGNSAEAGMTFVELGDLDSDGDQDVLSVNSYRSPDGDVFDFRLSSYVNRGNLQGGALGSLFAVDSESVTGGVVLSDMHLADIDGDGDLDALLVSDSIDPFRIIINEGVTPADFDQRWLNGDDADDPAGDPPVDAFLGGTFTDVAIGDLNNDTHLDAFLTLDNGREDQVWFGSANGTFTNSGQSIGGQSGSAVTLFDWDNDGDLDALVANNGFSTEAGFEEDQIWINDGIGTGNFLTSIGLGAASKVDSRDIAVGDLDGDGDFDIVTAGATSLLWPREANGSLGSPANLNVDANAVGLGVITDEPFFGDDIVLVGSNESALFTARGFGARSRYTEVEYSYNGEECEYGTDPDCFPYYSYTPHAFNSQTGDAVALADVDEDGILDVIVSSRPDSNGNGKDRFWSFQGSEGVGPSYSVYNEFFGRYTIEDNLDTQVGTVVADDWDDDGDTDVFLGNRSAGGLETPNQLFLNQGGVVLGSDRFSLGDKTDGLGNPVPNHDLGGGTVAAASGDFNGDGNLDLFLIPESTTLRPTANPIVAFSPPLGIGVPDFANGFVSSDQVISSLVSVDVALGDLDRDGDLDAFVATGGPTDQVWLNEGGKQGGVEGVFTDTFQPFGNTTASAVKLGDLDGDGDLDAFVANRGLVSPFGSSGYEEFEPNKVWINDGAGKFDDSGLVLGDHETLDVAIGDLDGDGDLDAITINKDGNSYLDHLKVWRNDTQVWPTTNFDFQESIPFNGQNAEVLTFLYGATSVELGDIDGDGDLDVVVGGSNQVLFNDGAGFFANQSTLDDPTAFPIGRYTTFSADGVTDIELRDMDQDGDLDIVATVSNDTPNAAAGGNRVFLNRTVMTAYFDGVNEGIEPVIRFVDSGVRLGALAHVGGSGLDIADINADGDLDALFVNEFGSPNRLFFGDSRGLSAGEVTRLTSNGQSLGTASSSDVEFGDLDGDGDPDAFIANYQAGNRILRNTKIQSGITTLGGLTVGPDDSFIYAVDPNKDALVVLSVDSSGSFETVQTLGNGFGNNRNLAGASVVSLVPDGSAAYVAAPVDSSVVIYDRQSDSNAADFGQLSSPTAVSNPLFNDVQAIDISPDGQHVYLATGTVGQILRVVPEIEGTAPLLAEIGHASFVALSPDGLNVFAIDGVGGTLHVFDRELQSLQTTAIPVGSTQLTSIDLGGGETLLAILGEDETMTVIRLAVDGSLVPVQTIRNGVGGVRGLGGNKAIAVSGDGIYVYVTSDRSDSLAVFKRDDATDRFSLVQYVRNGNSRTLGLRSPNSVVVTGDGTVLVGSTAGAESDRGGIASFLTPNASEAQTATFTVGFEAIEKLTLQTAGGADNFAQLQAPSVPVTIDAGDGDNTIDLFAASSSTTLITGDGRDVIDLRASDAGVVYDVQSGAESDTVTVRQLGAGGTVQVDAGDGDDLVIAIGPNLVVAADGSASVTLRGGAGDDQLEFDSAGLETDPIDRVAIVPSGTVSATGHAVIDYFSFEDALIITPPVPDLGGPYTINEGELITLDASGTILNGDGGVYAWDLNGDGEFDELLGDFDQPTISLTFEDLVGLGINDDGVYPIAMRVTNDRGQTSDGFSSITVADTAPVITITSNPTSEVGQEHVLDLSVFDPGNDTIQSWTIDWGDSSAPTEISGDVSSATHRYDNTGTYTISVSGRDEDNPTPADAYTENVTVDVSASTPVIAGPIVFDEGKDMVLTASASGSPTYRWTVDGVALADTTDSETILTWAQLVMLGASESSGVVDLEIVYSGGGLDTAVAATTYSVTNVAPTFEINSDLSTLSEGQTVSVSITDVNDFSSSDQAAGFRYAFDYDNDGLFEVTDSGSSSVSIQVSNAGNQVIVGRVTDARGASRDVPIAVSVREVTPTVSLAGNATVMEGSPYNLVMSATDPGDDVINSWFIDWGDGNESRVDAATADIDHTYADNGEFEITVTAVDEDGAYVTTKNVNVENVTPVLGVTTPVQGFEGEAFTLELASIDPGDDRITQWSIDWGDGTIDTVGGSAESATYAYADDGTYQIMVMAVDEDVDIASPDPVMQTAVIGNAPPRVTLDGADEVNEGTPYALSITPPDDSGTDVATIVSIDWGDGSAVEVIDIPSINAEGFIPTTLLTHTYADSGSGYTITATIVDEDGTFLSPETKTVVVNDVSPQVTLLGVSRIPVDQPFALNLAEIVDSGTDTATEFRIDWGDGSAVEVVSALGVVNHTYALTGDYQIVVDVVDEDAIHVAAGTRQLVVDPLAAAFAPQVLDIVINEGELQRSAVKTIRVVFDQVVSIDENGGSPFLWNNTTTGEFATSTWTADHSSGQTIVRFLFDPSGDSVTPSGSLENGEYEFTILSSRISASGILMDGNGDGSVGDDYVFGDDATEEFFRKYGDASGNGLVDLLDFSFFRSAFGQTSAIDDFREELDANHDGRIDLADFAVFRAAFGK